MSIKPQPSTEIDLLKAYREGAFSSDELMKSVGPDFGALVEVSPETAIRLALAAGGRDVWVPMTTSRTSSLRSMMDEADVEVLCNIYRGCRIKVPTLSPLKNALRRRRIAALRRDGWKLNELAELFQLTDRQILNILKKHREEQE
ncbi:hypothetical protein [Marinobacter sp. MCTG268]|uniref:hypothetical protein n=1 Tax=Marinobacter adhaerens TaxID=1033846 RepID=UPI0005666936